MKGGGSVGGEREEEEQRQDDRGKGRTCSSRRRRKEALSLRGMLSGSRSFVSLTDYADLCKEISDQASFPPTIASVSPPLDPRHRSFDRLAEGGKA
ncbi:hypothetical protein MUK42_08926 [Musa troglodytarum]|uniref:Uncharacterized protein n=1 Tax=Musa troglodytarum TaxID=320322 RepID=A0A9E7ECH2_9LILI|nr:hypothetical protein MUK42_08926 [Musa troglodytarum]